MSVLISPGVGLDRSVHAGDSPHRRMGSSGVGTGSGRAGDDRGVAVAGRQRMARSGERGTNAVGDDDARLGDEARQGERGTNGRAIISRLASSIRWITACASAPCSSRGWV